MRKIIVIAEHRNGKLAEHTIELCKAAQDIAAGLQAEPAAVLLATDDALVAELAQYIPEVIIVTDPKLAHYSADGYTQAITSIAGSNDIKGIIIAHSYDGIDFAAQVALALDAGIISNCNKARVDSGKLIFTRSTFNGKIQEERTINTDKFVATFEKGAFDPAANSGQGKITPAQATIGDIRTTVKELIETMAGAVDITQAKIIVAGGRGLKDGDKYKELIIPLAEKIGGEYAASRPVVDSGWTEQARQVGQSGKTVAPNVYFAIGISGAIQHIAGMKGAQCIVAINKDPEAPIFNIATYGIVGDLFEVVPAILENL